jgi:hypothetical protein
MRQAVFIFKVALTGHKGVWRRIALRGGHSLDDLHEAIFGAFDRDDEHLYSFYFPKPGTKGRSRLRDAPEYTHPYAVEDRGAFGEASSRLAGFDAGAGFRVPIRLRRRVVARNHGGTDRCQARKRQVPSGAGNARQVPAAVLRHGRGVAGLWREPRPAIGR